MIMFAPKKILVPTDFSEYSDEALRQAADIAGKFNSQIYLLHVYDEGVQQCVTDYCIPSNVLAQIEGEAITSSKERMEKEVQAIIKEKHIDIVFDIVKGFPYEVILKEQQEKTIDLIVIASHGKTGILKHLIGSVAEKVVRSAKCEVLLIKKNVTIQHNVL
jgi:nucleotide-binding universal stress UspA family protein